MEKQDDLWAGYPPDLDEWENQNEEQQFARLLEQSKWMLEHPHLLTSEQYSEVIAALSTITKATEDALLKKEAH